MSSFCGDRYCFFGRISGFIHSCTLILFYCEFCIRYVIRRIISRIKRHKAVFSGLPACGTHGIRGFSGVVFPAVYGFGVGCYIRNGAAIYRKKSFSCHLSVVTVIVSPSE